MYGGIGNGIGTMLVVGVIAIFFFMLPAIGTGFGLILVRLITGEWIWQYAFIGGGIGFIPAVLAITSLIRGL